LHSLLFSVTIDARKDEKRPCDEDVPEMLHENPFTFTTQMAGAYLPGVPVAAPRSVADVCPQGPISFSTARVVALAETEDAACAVLILPGSVLRMGRNRLWRLRDEVASSLTPDIRELLTRRRCGVFDVGGGGEGPSLMSK
jgi:hypothetical protein